MIEPNFILDPGLSIFPIYLTFIFTIVFFIIVIKLEKTYKCKLHFSIILCAPIIAVGASVFISIFKYNTRTVVQFYDDGICVKSNKNSNFYYIDKIKNAESKLSKKESFHKFDYVNSSGAIDLVKTPYISSYFKEYIIELVKNHEKNPEKNRGHSCDPPL